MMAILRVFDLGIWDWSLDSWSYGWAASIAVILVLVRVRVRVLGVLDWGDGGRWVSVWWVNG